jgi:hypothetical protein
MLKAYPAGNRDILKNSPDRQAAASKSQIIKQPGASLSLRFIS